MALFKGKLIITDIQELGDSSPISSWRITTQLESETFDNTDITQLNNLRVYLKGRNEVGKTQWKRFNIDDIVANADIGFILNVSYIFDPTDDGMFVPSVDEECKVGVIGEATSVNGFMATPTVNDDIKLSDAQEIRNIDYEVRDSHLANYINTTVEQYVIEVGGQDNTKLPLSGGTITGGLEVQGNLSTNVATITNDGINIDINSSDVLYTTNIMSDSDIAITNNVNTENAINKENNLSSGTILNDVETLFGGESVYKEVSVKSNEESTLTFQTTGNTQTINIETDNENISSVANINIASKNITITATNQLDIVGDTVIEGSVTANNMIVTSDILEDNQVVTKKFVEDAIATLQFDNDVTELSNRVASLESDKLNTSDLQTEIENLTFDNLQFADNKTLVTTEDVEKWNANGENLQTLQTTVSNLEAIQSTFELKSEKGVANGYAPLNADGKVGVEFLPEQPKVSNGVEKLTRSEFERRLSENSLTSNLYIVVKDVIKEDEEDPQPPQPPIEDNPEENIPGGEEGGNESGENTPENPNEGEGDITNPDVDNPTGGEGSEEGGTEGGATEGEGNEPPIEDNPSEGGSEDNEQEEQNPSEPEGNPEGGEGENTPSEDNPEETNPENPNPDEEGSEETETPEGGEEVENPTEENPSEEITPSEGEDNPSGNNPEDGNNEEEGSEEIPNENEGSEEVGDNEDNNVEENNPTEDNTEDNTDEPENGSNEPTEEGNDTEEEPNTDNNDVSEDEGTTIDEEVDVQPISAYALLEEEDDSVINEYSLYYITTYTKEDVDASDILTDMNIGEQQAHLLGTYNADVLTTDWNSIVNKPDLVTLDGNKINVSDLPDTLVYLNENNELLSNGEIKNIFVTKSEDGFIDMESFKDVVTEGEYFKVNVNAKGLVVGGTNSINWSDISDKPELVIKSEMEGLKVNWADIEEKPDVVLFENIEATNVITNAKINWDMVANKPNLVVTDEQLTINNAKISWDNIIDKSTVIEKDDNNVINGATINWTSINDIPDIVEYTTTEDNDKVVNNDIKIKWDNVISKPNFATLNENNEVEVDWDNINNAPDNFATYNSITENEATTKVLDTDITVNWGVINNKPNIVEFETVEEENIINNANINWENVKNIPNIATFVENEEEQTKVLADDIKVNWENVDNKPENLVTLNEDNKIDGALLPVQAKFDWHNTVDGTGRYYGNGEGVSITYENARINVVVPEGVEYTKMTLVMPNTVITNSSGQLLTVDYDYNSSFITEETTSMDVDDNSNIIIEGDIPRMVSVEMFEVGAENGLTPVNVSERLVIKPNHIFNIKAVEIETGYIITFRM